MKKLLVLFAFLGLFVLSGCTSNIEESFQKMEEVESYRMDIFMDNVPMFGTMSFVIKVDGDLHYSSSLFDDEGTYSKMVDGEEYEYSLNSSGEYVLSETPVDDPDEDDALDDDIFDMIDYDDFENTDENRWEYIENRLYVDDEEKEYLEDFIIELTDDNYVELMTFTMYTDDMKVDVEIEISGLNETTVNLPE